MKKKYLKNAGNSKGRYEDENVYDYINNAPIDAALMLLLTEENEEDFTKSFITFLNVLAKRLSENAIIPMPFVDESCVLFKNLENLLLNEDGTSNTEVTFDEDVHLKMDTMTDPNGRLWFPVFTSEIELNKGEVANVIVPVPMYDVLKAGLDDPNVEGVVFNPFDRFFTMDKDLLRKILVDYERWSNNAPSVPSE